MGTFRGVIPTTEINGKLVIDIEKQEIIVTMKLGKKFTLKKIYLAVKDLFCESPTLMKYKFPFKIPTASEMVIVRPWKLIIETE